ncbi:MAG: FAD-dependent oxidoreductase [Proteobacteria bacterium]|nr:FAD-dependent oxidoreductase [Pseudomonadota bacterium]MBU2228067.1 FAD-dependent oxidoreductase [Pseudomonadota bacterium]MBU2260958.1 FAD-dependent oxidoreductase [Pseudomonadota bacterium]
MRYPTVFQPCRIGSLTLKNRLAMSQMTMNYATEEGLVTDKLIAYYTERAKGGVGLIFVEGTYFTPEGKGYVRQIGLASQKHVEGLKRLTDSVHGLKNDTRIFLQIHHAGGRASAKVTGLQPVAPSAVPPYPGAEMPRELTREEVSGLVEAHVEAAARAREAGFDGVDIHCAHGYLVPSFLSPLTNRRADEYGGDLTGRTRFLLEIIRGIRKRLGPDFPLTIKISGDEYIEGGLGIRDMIDIARLAEEAGIDGLIVSAGTVGGKKLEDLSEPHKVMRTLPMMTKPGCLVPIAAEFKKSLRIPVITLGRINEIALAEEILKEGKADIVAIGRPLLADPELPKKAAEGREAEIRPCIACNEGCYKRILQQLDVRCSVNPLLGKEGDSAVRRASPAKRILFVGAGPAGMEAACRARERGHDVTLIEKNAAAGGQLLLASVPPGRREIEHFTNYLRGCLKRSGVKVILNEEVSPSVIRRLQPDAVIIATGAQPCVLAVQGLQAAQGVTSWDVLSGKPMAGGPYLIVGAGLVGCETADLLSDRGEKVTLVEILPEIACDADKDTKAYFDIRFQNKGVKVYTGANLVRMEDRLAIIRNGDEEIRIETGTVVFSVGAKPEDSLYDQLISMGIEVIKAGDCVKPRSILDSVEEGFLAGNRV